VSVRPPLLSICLALSTVLATLPAIAQDPISIDDARFATDIGALSNSMVTNGPTSSSHLPAQFNGRPALSCINFDLNTFLRHFDPHEMLSELRQSLLSGAQSAISNYLIALAYSAPTLASVLDMSDRQLGARFTSFAQTCSTQQVRAIQRIGTSHRLAQASDQCFAREMASGTAPTEAYRLCAVTTNFDRHDLPAGLSTIDFLRKHTDLEMTPRTEFLLGLLPDQRIKNGHFEIRAPLISLPLVSDALQSRSRLALDQLLDGAAPTDLSECPLDPTAADSTLACLPSAASALVSSPAFRGARLLGAAARSIFKEALSRQIAVVAVHSDLLNLTQQIAKMGLRSDSDADADEMQTRQSALDDQLAHLLSQARLQVELQEIKSQIARTQMLALQRAQDETRIAADALRAEESTSEFGERLLLRLFQNRD
jgi:hypothetical protein